MPVIKKFVPFVNILSHLVSFTSICADAVPKFIKNTDFGADIVCKSKAGHFFTEEICVHLVTRWLQNAKLAFQFVKIMLE